MKKFIIVIIVLAIIGGVVWKFNSGTTLVLDNPYGESTTTVPTSQTIKVSEKLLEYKNDELGFAVKYPNSWEKGESPASIKFNIPAATSSTEKNTIGSLQSQIDIFSGKCAFPPVTSVKERSTLKVGDLSFNMISIANTLQGRNYFNRMYSLQKDSICYFFSFSSVTLSPTSKGFTGKDAQKVGARNTVLVDTADTQFKDMIKSFNYVVGPAGKDETQVSPIKK